MSPTNACVKRRRRLSLMVICGLFACLDFIVNSLYVNLNLNIRFQKTRNRKKKQIMVTVLLSHLFSSFDSEIGYRYLFSLTSGLFRRHSFVFLNKRGYRRRIADRQPTVSCSLGPRYIVSSSTSTHHSTCKCRVQSNAFHNWGCSHNKGGGC